MDWKANNRKKIMEGEVRNKELEAEMLEVNNKLLGNHNESEETEDDDENEMDDD